MEIDMKISALLMALALVVSQSAIAAMCPDGTYVSGNNCTMAPDGSYVGGGKATMAPDGSYVALPPPTSNPNIKSLSPITAIFI